MNKKAKGEIGERIAIGELAKFGIDVMLPMSDNLPFDIVVYYNGKFFKCQVKTSTHITKEGGLYFDIRSNDWYRHTNKIYTSSEVDVWVLCDMKTIYLLRFEENSTLKAITLREHEARSGQKKKIRLFRDYIISEKRISEVFI